MTPPLAFFYCFGAIVVLAMVVRGPDLLPGWTMPIGLALLSAGTMLNAWAMRAFERAGTSMDPDERPAALVQDGPYRYTRNPMYLGGILLLTGAVLLTDAAHTAVVLPVYAYLAARRFVPSDERRMNELFGAEWRDYTRRVRRWL